jgi:hypothetical protein
MPAFLRYRGVVDHQRGNNDKAWFPEGNFRCASIVAAPLLAASLRRLYAVKAFCVEFHLDHLEARGKSGQIFSAAADTATAFGDGGRGLKHTS